METQYSITQSNGSYILWFTMANGHCEKLGCFATIEKALNYTFGSAMLIGD